MDNEKTKDVEPTRSRDLNLEKRTDNFFTKLNKLDGMQQQLKHELKEITEAVMQARDKTKSISVLFDRMLGNMNGVRETESYRRKRRQKCVSSYTKLCSDKKSVHSDSPSQQSQGNGERKPTIANSHVIHHTEATHNDTPGKQNLIKSSLIPYQINKNSILMLLEMLGVSRNKGITTLKLLHNREDCENNLSLVRKATISSGTIRVYFGDIHGNIVSPKTQLKQLNEGLRVECTATCSVKQVASLPNDAHQSTEYGNKIRKQEGKETLEETYEGNQQYKNNLGLELLAAEEDAYESLKEKLEAWFNNDEYFEEDTMENNEEELETVIYINI